MSERLKYIKRVNQPVVAVQLALETDGFTYRKWGGPQKCRAYDWIVDNDGDVYTVDRETFERTYRRESTGNYVKITPVWAQIAKEAGHIPTKEGATHYGVGDYLVFNEEQGGDGYAVSADKFKAMYQRAE